MDRSIIKNISRRTFVKFTAGAFAASACNSQYGYSAINGSVDLEKMLIINGLGGISNQNLWVESVAGETGSIGEASIRRLRSIDERAIQDAHASGTTAINVTLGYVAGPEEPYEYTLNDIARWDSIIEKYPHDLLKVQRTDDILRAKRENKIGIIFGFQNAVSVGDEMERIKTFSDLGVRIIQLTYNGKNQIGSGSMVKEDKGLTPTGYRVVESLNENKVVVDLSHSGERTCRDAIKASKSPIMISHTGCHVLSNVTRNKTDEELRLVAEKGGVVGIYFMPFLRQDGQPEAQDVIKHIEHAIHVCGEDHVGIGTDGDTTNIDDMGEYRQAISREVRQRQKHGISTAGESDGVVPLIPDLMGPAQFQKLADLLSLKGHGAARIEKILGANFFSLFKTVWS